jgi:hypothetical protein
MIRLVVQKFLLSIVSTRKVLPLRIVAVSLGTEVNLVSPPKHRAYFHKNL